jgi:hypothetical protein
MVTMLTFLDLVWPHNETASIDRLILMFVRPRLFQPHFALCLDISVFLPSRVVSTTRQSILGIVGECLHDIQDNSLKRRALAHLSAATQHMSARLLNSGHVQHVAPDSEGVILVGL